MKKIWFYNDPLVNISFYKLKLLMFVNLVLTMYVLTIVIQPRNFSIHRKSVFNYKKKLFCFKFHNSQLFKQFLNYWVLILIIFTKTQ